MFQSRSGQTLPTHFIIWRDDRFEPYSNQFRRWNLLGRIQCPRRGANPPGVQIWCRRGLIRVPTNIYSSIETRAHLLALFRAHSDGGFFRSGFPVGSGYHISPESLIFADLSVHASDLLSSYDHGYFLLFYCIPVQIQEILLTSRFYISSRLLYFHAWTIIIHDIEQLTFYTLACILLWLLNTKYATCTCNNPHAPAITNMQPQ